VTAAVPKVFSERWHILAMSIFDRPAMLYRRISASAVLTSSAAELDKCDDVKPKAENSVDELKYPRDERSTEVDETIQRKSRGLHPSERIKKT
jgi:hypothetical protein